jgi:hypothetical protein
MDLFQPRPRIRFQARQFGFLLEVVNGLLSFFPCLLAFSQQRTPEPPQFIHLFIEQLLLPFCGIRSILERLQHGRALILSWSLHYHSYSPTVRRRILAGGISSPYLKKGASGCVSC